jgi:hypothetical protein
LAVPCSPNPEKQRKSEGGEAHGWRFHPKHGLATIAVSDGAEMQAGQAARGPGSTARESQEDHWQDGESWCQDVIARTILG